MPKINAKRPASLRVSARAAKRQKKDLEEDDGRSVVSELKPLPALNLDEPDPVTSDSLMPTDDDADDVPELTPSPPARGRASSKTVVTPIKPTFISAKEMLTSTESTLAPTESAPTPTELPLTPTEPALSPIKRSPSPAKAKAVPAKLTRSRNKIVAPPIKTGVQTHLPIPAGVVTTTMRDYFTKPLVTRLNKMINHEDSEKGHFALGRLPTNLKWGSGANAPNNYHDYLCYQSEPVQVWMVGEVETCKFREWAKNSSGDSGSFSGAAKKPSITIRPLIAADEQRAKDMILWLANPFQTPPELKEGGITISRFMTSQRSKDEIVPRFKNVFDATKPPEDDEPLPDIDGLVLKEFDIVLVIARLHRYYVYWTAAEVDAAYERIHEKEEYQQRGTTFKHQIRFQDEPPYGLRRKYWRVTWELDSIFQVLSAPETARAPICDGRSLPF